MAIYHNTAIVFGPLKDALLFYEHVIPFNLSGQGTLIFPGQTGEASMDTYRDVEVLASSNSSEVLKLCPPGLASDPRFPTALNAFDGFLFQYLIKTAFGEERYKGYMGQLAKVVGSGPLPPDKDLWCPSADDLQRVFSKIASDFQLQGIPVDCSPFATKNEANQPADDSVYVPGIRVVDTERVPFAKILEFRKEKESLVKMRKFRLFAFEHYTGRDKAYVEDDIQQRLSDYNDVIRSWGFETKLQAITFILNSKFLAGAFATSAIALLFGTPELAKDALSAGAIVEIGRLSLEFAKQKHELARIARENPISYISDAKTKLEPK